jgi:hypothetical protein
MQDRYKLCPARMQTADGVGLRDALLPLHLLLPWLVCGLLTLIHPRPQTPHPDAIDEAWSRLNVLAQDAATGVSEIESSVETQLAAKQHTFNQMVYICVYGFSVWRSASNV